MMAWLRARRERTARMDRALLALERSAQGAEVERARLQAAVALSHQALGAMGEALERMAGQPARHDAVVDAAARRLARAADDLGRDLARRVDLLGVALEGAVADLAAVADRRIAAELAPVRGAAADHAAWIRAALDRMRQETDALGGARQAAAAVGDLSAAAEEALRAVTDRLAAAERAGTTPVPALPARKRSPRRPAAPPAS